MHLQTKGSPGHPPRDATDITTAEFNNIFSQLISELQARKYEAGLRRAEHFIICLDHATVHNEAAGLLPPGWQLLPQPAHSPDCNKPIEHVHGQMDEKMHSWLRELRASTGTPEPTPQQCMSQCRDFFRAVPTSSIAADIATLPATWQAIVAAGGAYVADALS